MKVNPLVSKATNPIRSIVDDVVGKQNPAKELISLAQGDPTAYGHLKPPEEAVAAVVRAFLSGNHNGYTASSGSAACRAAIATSHSCENRPPLSRDDVFVTVGCSEALEHCITVLAAPGANVLLPRPGFPLYETICRRHGVSCHFYDLLPENGWEVDLESVGRAFDDSTVALLINNPSNPCGAVYSREHLKNLVALARSFELPIIADEVYEGITFGKPFIPVAEVAGKVPVLSVSALSKRWLVPGWRLGWLCIHEIGTTFNDSGVRAAINRLCQISLGPSTPLQAATPTILALDDSFWLKNVLNKLMSAAAYSADRVARIHGLSILSPPHGAMYVLVHVDRDAFRDCPSDLQFAEKLLEEESVLVLPGTCFRAPGFVRIVTTVPEHVLQAAWDRVESFCVQRYIRAIQNADGSTSPVNAGRSTLVSLPRVASYLGGHEGLLLKPPFRRIPKGEF